jgi:nanoRNase/pAp phosphatase (c-di-AMP/oligoRNAs hydrolase)
MSASPVKRSSRLLKILAGYEQVLIVMHDNPDPDAIASGWALVVMIREKLQKKARLIGGGAIIRAENCHMLELLAPPVELIDQIDCPENTAVILVDCQPGNQNHLFSRNHIAVAAVIDHHEGKESGRRIPFMDIRPNAAASATIATSYLREQGIEPGTRLATGLQFAIRTEARGSESRFTRFDRSMLLWVTERSNPSYLAEIENAPLTRDYFGDLILALQNTMLYDDTAFCMLPRVHGAEIVGEVADLLIRCNQVSRVLCGAVIGENLVLSVRTERDEDDAAVLVRTVLKGIGQGGGHRRRAGGKISGAERRITEDLIEDLRNRWLNACQVDRQRGSRLVPRRDIVEHL